MIPEITKEVLIEELIDNHSFSVRFLMENGIRCVMCGEPIWGTLGEAAIEKGFTVEKIKEIVMELNRLAKIEKEDGTGAVLIEVSKVHHSYY